MCGNDTSEVVFPIGSRTYDHVIINIARELNN